MDGERIRSYWNNEMEAVLKTYEQFATLVPSSSGKGADHRGEDGRYVEALIKKCLRMYLPRDLEVLTGFILRPAVKVSSTDRGRAREKDSHSTQLDILVYDSANYPVYQRIEDHVIVPPEGVIGVISVKKTLTASNVTEEVQALERVGRLCVFKNGKEEVRGPFLGLVSMKSSIAGTAKEQGEKVFKRLKASFPETGKNRYDWMPGFIGSLSQWSIIKRKPGEKKNTEYLLFEHGSGESHMGLQFIVSQILSVYYGEGRGNVKKPGFTAFESGRKSDKRLGTIPYIKEHGDYKC